MTLADVEANRLVRLNLDTEAVHGSGSLDRLRFGIDPPAVANWPFEYEYARFCRGVVDKILNLLDVYAVLLEHALADADPVHVLCVVRVVCRHAYRLIHCVGEQSLLGGMDRLQQAFAPEAAVLDDGERA